MATLMSSGVFTLTKLLYRSNETIKPYEINYMTGVALLPL